MDLSKEYIKMCDCKELQDTISKNKVDWRNQGYCKKHKCLTTEDMDGCPQCGGMMAKIYKDNELGGYIDRTSLWDEEMCEYNQWIVLPYQDQLQGIYCSVMVNRTEVFDLISEIFRFANTNPISEVCKSIEQLWLVFVMWEIHQKKWNGKKWI